MSPLETSTPKAAGGRGIAFVLVLAVATLMAGLYVVRAARRERGTADSVTAPSATDLAAIRARAHVMFLATDGDAYRRIAVAPLDDPSQRLVTDIQCQRVHYCAGRGIALGSANDTTGATVLDDGLRAGLRFAIDAVPSRARVAPDGQRAAFTFFVLGDSYATAGFSTRTYIADLADPAGTLVDMETFTLWRGGRKVEALDINYWGVTFSRDGTDFYATVATNDRRYLVRANTLSREAFVVHDDVECPSLSPDGRHIAFKKRIATDGALEWRLAVLELSSGTIRRLENESRSVDDQVEWLDDAHVLYALRDEGPPSTLRPDIWSLALDGASPPSMFLKGAMSPVVVRP